MARCRVSFLTLFFSGFTYIHDTRDNNDKGINPNLVKFKLAQSKLFPESRNIGINRAIERGKQSNYSWDPY